MGTQDDSAVSVEVGYPGTTSGRAVWDMDSAERRMVSTVQGSQATASSPAFAVPHLEPFLIITDDFVANAELVDTVYRRAGLGLGG